MSAPAQAFPQTTTYVRGRSEGADLKEYEDYLNVIEYHLDGAVRCGHRAGLLLEGVLSSDPNAPFRLLEGAFVYGVSLGPAQLVLFKFPPQGVIWNGDWAVREAASALDAGLLLTSYVLDLGIAAKDVRWSDYFQERLKKKVGEDNNATKLLFAIFESKSEGYYLLTQYRHWVTHRGAPKISGDIPPEALTVPDSVINETNSEDRVSKIRRQVADLVRKYVKVRCAPFVIPVRSVGRIEGKNYLIKRVIHVDGQLTDAAGVFSEKNPVELHEGMETVAGTQLATYTVSDYLMAVDEVVRYVQETLVGEWDAMLAERLGASK